MSFILNMNILKFSLFKKKKSILSTSRHKNIGISRYFFVFDGHFHIEIVA